MANPRATITDQEALLFHSQGRPGKIEIRPTKPLEVMPLLPPTATPREAYADRKSVV